MSLSLEQLQEFKLQLKKFSQLPVQQTYKIIAQIYKSDLSPDLLNASEITKSITRIGLKSYKDSDDEKYIKMIKICRKLVKKWKELFKVGESVEEHKHKQTPNLEDNRQKAIVGINKFFSKYSQGDFSELSQQLETQLHVTFKDLDIYKTKVKGLARKIDQEPEFRDKLLNAEISPKEAIIMI